MKIFIRITHHNIKIDSRECEVTPAQLLKTGIQVDITHLIHRYVLLEVEKLLDEIG